MRWIPLLLALPGFTLPLHPQFVKGEGKVQNREQLLQIEAADRSVIHWDQFNIDLLESVQFSLPSSSSAVLNRVTGGALSQILGSITSNGQVLLINPAGILIGRDAVIDTARWVASTLDIQDRMFLDGDAWHFNGSSEASIQIDGTIRSNRVAVLAKHILAPGVIEGDQIDLIAGLSALVTGGGARPDRKTAIYDTSSIDVHGRMKTAPNGKVTLFSDGICSFHGHIDSPSGFVEISGMQDVVCKGIVDTGKTGTLLLDPNQITISSIPPTNPAPLTAVYNGSPLSVANVLDTDLTTLLAGTSVVIQTAGAIAGTGNIIVDADLVWNSGTNLTLHAHNSVLVNRLINPTGPGSLVNLMADQGDVVLQSVVGVPAGIQTDGLYPAGSTAVNIFCPNGSLTIIAATDTATRIQTNNLISAGDLHVTAAAMNFTAANSVAANSSAAILTRRGDAYFTVSGPVNFTAGNGTMVAFEADANVVAGIDFGGAPINGNIFFNVGSIHFDSSPGTGGVRSAASFTAYAITPGFGNVTGTVAGDVLIEAGFPFACGSGVSAIGGGNIDIAIGGNVIMISNAGPSVLFSGTGFNSAFPGPAGPGNVNLAIAGNVVAISGGGLDSGSGFVAQTNLNVAVGGSALFQVTNGTAASLSGVALRSAAGSIQFAAQQATFQGNRGTPLASSISAPGNVSIATQQGLIFDFADVTGSSVDLRSTQSSVFINNGTTLSANGQLLVHAAQNIVMGTSFATSLTDRVIFVVDEAFPSPFVGSGFLSIDAASTLNAPGGISLYTARQNLNSILGLLNGATFISGALFVDTASEVWCTYFPNGTTTFPFTVFYKDCLNAVAYQASLSITEMLRDLHPYDENLGWFQLMQMSSDEMKEPYFLRRRELYLNHPKSWTTISH